MIDIEPYLESPNSLLTTLLGHLLPKILLRLGSVLRGTLPGSFLRRLSVFGSYARTLLHGLLRSINACVRVQALLISLGSRLGILSNGVGVISWVVTLVSTLDLLSQVVLGKVGSIMPGVVFSRAIDLRKFGLIGTHFAGSIRGCVTRNIPEEDGSVTHWAICQRIIAEQ